MDPELAEELGMKPRASKEVREMLGSYLDHLAQRVKGDEMGRIKVRMKKTHVIVGQGIQIPKGHVMQIPEEAFDAMNRKLGGKLERMDKAAVTTPQERPATPPESGTKDMKPVDSVSKDSPGDQDDT